MQFPRITKLDYYLHIASAVSLRSTCIRSAYGSVIVLDDRIVSTGYNGSPRGHINCIDSGTCAREGIETRTRYELCRAVHAEQNAIINARSNVSDATIFIAGFNNKTGKDKSGDACLPCMMCYRAMVNAGIKAVCIYDNDFKPKIYAINELSFVNSI